MNHNVLATYLHHLENGSTLRWKGRLNQVVGNLMESEGPFGFVGESCEIETADGRSYAGEIIGFRGSTVLSMAVDHPHGVRLGDSIVAWGARPSVRVGPGLLGRVIDPAGNPLDGKGQYRWIACPFVSHWVVGCVRSMDF
jgi:flagellum-specific ATP synthase